ncbi:MAG: hypothetical protein ACPGUV_10695 [Polyangiales bacterium]
MIAKELSALWTHKPSRPSAALWDLRPVPAQVDWPVLVVTALLLTAAATYAWAQQPAAQSVQAFGGRVTLTLAPGWHLEPRDGMLFARPAAVDDPMAGLSIRRLHASRASRPPDPALLDLHLAQVESSRARSGHGYRVLRTEQTRSFGGHAALWTHYALVRDPQDHAPGAAVLPVVVRGVDVVLHVAGGDLYHVATWGTTQASNHADPAAILASLRFLSP